MVATAMVADVLPEPEADGRAHPFLKWAGSKRASVTTISPLLPVSINRYYEPMIGGGALFFWLAAQPKRFASASIGDTNPDLMTCYKVIRDDVEGLIQQLRQYRYEKAFYDSIRSVDPATLDPMKRAARFIYLNRTCFNGLYRVNRSGRFNVPFGRHTNPTICDADNLRCAHRVLSTDEHRWPERATLLVMDFGIQVADAKLGDAVYFDPPYIPLTKTANFTSYGPDKFGEVEQKRLAHAFADLADRGVAVALSNSTAPLAYELYGKFHIRLLPVRRNINSKAAKRGAVGEMLVTANCVGD